MLTYSFLKMLQKSTQIIILLITKTFLNYAMIPIFRKKLSSQQEQLLLKE